MRLEAIQSVRATPRFPVPGPRGVFVPTTQQDLVELRGLQYFLEHPDLHYPVDVKRAHVDALKRMLHTMEHGDPKSPAWWIAAALRRSMRKVSPTLYICTDRELNTWALDQIFELFPDEQ
jgi:hypothetical protein